MSFLDIVSGSWASVSGTATILSDPAIVHKYYTPALQAWLGDLGDGVHDGGPDDPRIGVIRLEAKAATYALSKKGIISKAVETGKAVAKGEAPSISRLREITEAELAQCTSELPHFGKRQRQLKADRFSRASITFTVELRSRVNICFRIPIE